MPAHQLSALTEPEARLLSDTWLWPQRVGEVDPDALHGLEDRGLVFRSSSSSGDLIGLTPEGHEFADGLFGVQAERMLSELLDGSALISREPNGDFLIGGARIFPPTYARLIGEGLAEGISRTSRAGRSHPALEITDEGREWYEAHGDSEES